jgi:hypothetical protein
MIVKKMAKGKSSVGKRSIATRDIGNSNFYEDGPAVTSGKMPKSGKPKGKK